MNSAQQVKLSLSFADTLLALAAKKKWDVVEIATEDLQALVDEVRQEQARIDRVKQLYDYFDNYAGEKDYIFSSQTIAAVISNVLLMLNIKLEEVDE